MGEIGVDRDDRVGETGAYAFDDGREARNLVVGVGETVAWFRGGCADVEDVGSVGEEPFGMGESIVERRIAAAVVEGVGADVQYAHNGRTVERDQFFMDTDAE